MSERFQFTGKAGEYFGIWIVNIFLTIATLGIYSAWAKVRRKRYFYGNTWVAGSNFEYHGDPLAILKGRVIALVAFLAYSFANHFSPRLGMVLLLVAMPLIPWLVLRSFAFNAANSSHRNIRFRFRGRYKEALLAFLPFAIVPISSLLLPEVDPNDPVAVRNLYWVLLVPPVIIAIVYPYVAGALKRLHVNGSAYGATAFATTMTIGKFYVIYGFAYVIAVAVLLMAGMAGAAVAWMQSPWLFVLLVPGAYILFFAVVIGYTQARVGNLTFETSRLGDDVGFTSTLSAIGLAKLYAVNLLAIVFSLGLAIPWATIRAQRYRAEHLVLECPNGIEAFYAQAGAPVGATAEAMGEFFDLDLSL